jgi:hypothetical protein
VFEKQRNKVFNCPSPKWIKSAHQNTTILA